MNILIYGGTKHVNQKEFYNLLFKINCKFKITKIYAVSRTVSQEYAVAWSNSNNVPIVVYQNGHIEKMFEELGSTGLPNIAIEYSDTFPDTLLIHYKCLDESIPIVIGKEYD